MTVVGADRDEPEILRHHFVAIATARYDNPPWDRHPLAGVAGELATMRSWLGVAGDTGATRDAVRFQERYPELADNPTLNQIESRLRDTPPRHRFRESDAAVLYVTGHGHVHDGTHCVVLRATEDGDGAGATALRTSDLVRWLKRTRIQHVLIVLDLCYSGRTTGDTWLLDSRPPPGWIGLAAATGGEPARVQVLTGAIDAFLVDLDSTVGERYAGVRQPFLRVLDFVSAIEERLAAAGQSLVLLFPALPKLTLPSPCLPNPHYRPLLGFEGALAAHWDPRSRGVATVRDPGWLFTGRAALMARLVEWTTGPARTVLVTGAAGTGKSAALARLVTLSDQDFVTAHRDRVAAIAPHLRPEVDAVDAAVVATGMYSFEVLDQLCVALRVPRGGPAAELEQRLDDWHDWLARRADPVTIVIDALDEAANPYALLTSLLERLEVTPARRRIRLAIGIRSPRRADATPPGAPGGDMVADLAESRMAATRFRVDEPPWWNAGDLTSYIGEVLTATAGSPYRRSEAGLTAAVAGAVAARAGRSFLVAQLAAANLADRATPVDPADPTWLATIDAGVAGIFRADLHQALPTPGDRIRAVDLLRAVAFAYGRGLPWGDIWPRMANAVADRPDDTGYTDSDVAWLLSKPIGAYLITDSVDGTTVYRLFHEALRRILRTDPDALLTVTP
ncbi:MAG TPA: ATP-binding protein [Catenuloplanes sp.]